MKRIVEHWTAGTNKVSALDLEHYHFIVDGEGEVHQGKYDVFDNESTKDGYYAAHTKDLNTDSIGVAMAGMHGARERPFDEGKHPLNEKQLAAFCKLVAKLCHEHNIPVTRQTVLSHAEVEPTLGVKQRGKWDITWLPGMTTVGDPVVVGDILRSRVQAELDALEQAQEVGPREVSWGPDAGVEVWDFVEPRKSETVKAATGFLSWLKRLFRR